MIFAIQTVNLVQVSSLLIGWQSLFKVLLEDSSFLLFETILREEFLTVLEIFMTQLSLLVDFQSLVNMDITLLKSGQILLDLLVLGVVQSCVLFP